MNKENEINKRELLRIGQVAEILNRSTQTIAHWYRAQKQGIGTTVKLPQPVWINGKRYFREEDIDIFFEFMGSLKRGDMAEYNEKFWTTHKKKKELEYNE